MELVDSHVHLQDYGQGIDVSEVVSQAAEAGVATLVCNGTNENDWWTVLDYAGKLPGVLPCLGLHPWFVSERSSGWFSTLEELVRTTNCGIGEIGLDRLYQNIDRPLQEESFRLQLELARRYERPVMVHCVRAWGWLMDVLRSEDSIPQGMLIHSYGGSADLIKPLAEMGAYFSFSGKALFEGHSQSRRSLAAVPIDRLLLETDTPNMLPPERFRAVSVLSSEGKELNHPANLPAILSGIADFLGQTPDELSEILWQNAGRFFGPLKTHQEL
ncbi:MAG: TatD family hydrolase [Armatimonadota bacterium]